MCDKEAPDNRKRSRNIRSGKPASTSNFVRPFGPASTRNAFPLLLLPNETTRIIDRSSMASRGRYKSRLQPQQTLGIAAQNHLYCIVIQAGLCNILNNAPLV